MTTMIHNPTTTTMINNSEQTNGMVQQQQSQDPNSQMMVDNSHVHPLAKTTSGGASPSSSSSSSRIPTTTTNYYTQSNDPMEIDNSHRHHSFNVSRHTERTGSDPTSDHYYRRQRESLSSFASNGPLHQDQQRKSTSHTISFGEAQPHHYHHEQLQSVLREIMVTGDDSDTLPPLKKT
ncbi:hypothetical protein BDA99DRAFT_526350 [Phascolomyces articulosus]|uniref:Uncharacterized protein n=1 Tax=Phascolomyces articulosus TaxID=60185 RepID=A0AAD5K1U2_9FUNG|nr:hypothetical protein BDA99DRAFT_526350 [Phascolomyces articulosus]